MFVLFFFFKQKTAYEMRISDWSSDVCSSDLGRDVEHLVRKRADGAAAGCAGVEAFARHRVAQALLFLDAPALDEIPGGIERALIIKQPDPQRRERADAVPRSPVRSEEHTSELQSLMRISYAVFCLKKKKT